MTFMDRADAGRRLGVRLCESGPDEPLVLALPRGGVVVGFEVARALGAALDVIPARKLGAPSQPELAIGAIAPNAVVVNDRIIRELGVSSGDLARTVGEEQLEMARRGLLFRSGRQPLDVMGKLVIIVDDGLATGATAAAAVKSVRLGEPRGVVLAVPVGARETVAALRAQVDDLVVLEVPDDFHSVGQWYDDFEQVTDDEVVDLLARAAAEHGRERR